MNNLFLFFLLIINHSFIWSDDVWFLIPSNGQPVSGEMEIKIYPPPESVPVYVWIESDSTEYTVWMGVLTLTNNYTLSVDTGRFKPGKYEINAVYYLYGDDFDGDIDIWVNSP